MFNNKKSQELTLNTVIIAVLALIILSMLLFISYKYIWGASSELEGFTKCESRGVDAECKERCDENDVLFFMYGGCGKDDNINKKYCCVPK